MSGSAFGLAFALHCTGVHCTTGTKVARNCMMEVDLLWSRRDIGGHAHVRLEYQRVGKCSRTYLYGSERRKMQGHVPVIIQICTCFFRKNIMAEPWHCHYARAARIAPFLT